MTHVWVDHRGQWDVGSLLVSFVPHSGHLLKQYLLLSIDHCFLSQPQYFLFPSLHLPLI